MVALVLVLALDREHLLNATEVVQRQAMVVDLAVVHPD
jgi:hypothetical protein